MKRLSWKYTVLLLGIAGCIAAGSWRGWQLLPTPYPARPPAKAEAPGPQRYNPMRLDIPPIDEPPLEYADDVNLEDEAIVIGIVVNGEPRAYLREAFEMHPHRHVVTDSIDSTPVAITHCDRLRCTRVFTGRDLEDPRTIRVGGWRPDQSLGLIVKEQEYSQHSPEIPLDEVPFVELPWGLWRELFPDTLVYVGPTEDHSAYRAG